MLPVAEKEEEKLPSPYLSLAFNLLVMVLIVQTHVETSCWAYSLIRSTPSFQDKEQIKERVRNRIVGKKKV